MRKLIMGVVEFRERLRPQQEERFRELAQGQAPVALLITCSDSRLMPQVLAASGPGDIFTMRNVGNLVPPATVEGHSTGDLSEASAIEYAVLALKVGTIILCGHSGCGAMKAVIARSPLAEAPNLTKWLRHAETAAFRLRQEGALEPGFTPHDQLSQLNVLVQLEHLMTYPLVQARVMSGALRLIGWWFEIATATMHTYERESHSFVPIDRAVAERLIARLEQAPGPRRA